MQKYQCYFQHTKCKKNSKYRLGIAADNFDNLRIEDSSRNNFLLDKNNWGAFLKILALKNQYIEYTRRNLYRLGIVVDNFDNLRIEDSSRNTFLLDKSN